MAVQDQFFLETTVEEIDYIEGNGGVLGIAKGTFLRIRAGRKRKG